MMLTCHLNDTRGTPPPFPSIRGYNVVLHHENKVKAASLVGSSLVVAKQAM